MLFYTIKVERGMSAADDTVAANRGWFNTFKARSNMHNIALQKEADIAVSAAAQVF